MNWIRTFRYPLLSTLTCCFLFLFSSRTFLHFLTFCSTQLLLSFFLLLYSFLSFSVLVFSFSWAFSGVSHSHFMSYHSIIPFFSCSSPLPHPAHPFSAFPSIPPGQHFSFTNSNSLNQQRHTPEVLSIPAAFICSSFRNRALYPSFRRAPLPDLHPAFTSPLHF